MNTVMCDDVLSLKILNLLLWVHASVFSIMETIVWSLDIGMINFTYEKGKWIKV